VFMKNAKKLHSCDPVKDSVSTWVYTITRNTVTDYFRTRRSVVSFEDYMLDEAPAAELTDDVPDSLTDVLLTLKEKERDLIVLHDDSGHNLKKRGGDDGYVLRQRQGDPQESATGLLEFFPAG